MRHLTLELRDLVRVPVQMYVVGSAKPVSFHLRGRVTGITDQEIEVRFLDDFQPLNGYPLHVSIFDAHGMEKITPPTT